MSTKPGRLVVALLGLVACIACNANEIGEPRVTYERLSTARNEPTNWLTYSGSYDGQRFSQLSEVDRSNVARLQKLWALPMDTSEPVETTPLVIDGVMYLTRPPNDVLAVRAETGEVLWEFSWPVPDDLVLCCGRINRGLAVLGNTLYLTTLDAHLVAIDAVSGAKKWDVQVADRMLGFNITGAPLAVKDMVITGPAANFTGTALAMGNPLILQDGEPNAIDRFFGDLQIDARGRIDAYDADTGELRWRFYTIPSPGEPGHETWESSLWKFGGSAAWMTGSYDPELNLLYWGIGNPMAPMYGEVLRPGDNLYSCSIVALDADTGELVWHYQFTPHDLHDWDATQVPVLTDLEIDGATRQVILTANRNGFFYVLDRSTGELLVATQYARQTWAEGIGEDGRPIKRPDIAPTVAGTTVSPAAGGSTSWWSPSYSRNTGLFYVTAHDGTETYWVPETPLAELLFRAASGEHVQPFVRGVDEDSYVSSVRALRPESGELEWEFRLPLRSAPGLLTTAGDLLFVGSTRGDFRALDAFTGQELWSGRVDGWVHAAPITFSTAGRQLVSVASSSGIHTFALDAGR